MPHRALAAMAIGIGLGWALPAAGQELLLHFPLDGTPAVAGSAAGDSRLYLFDGGPAPTTVPGRIGSALHFSGKAAIAMPFKLDAVTYPQVTITAWVRLDASPYGGTIFSAGNGNVPKLMVNVDRNNITAARGSLIARSAMPRGEWVFVAGVVDVGAARLENTQGETTITAGGINVGNLYPPSSYRNPDDPSLPAMPYVFVGSHGFGQWRANGMAIDDVRVYAGALTEEQVAAVREPGTMPGELAAPSLASGSLPQPAPGTDGLFQNDTLVIAAEDRPPGPLDLTGGAEGGGSAVPLLEAAPTATADGSLDPQLTAPEDSPAQQLEEAIAAAENATPPVPSGSVSEEAYRLDAEGPVRTIEIILPGDTVAQRITYQEVDGFAVMDGDMILGPVSGLQRWQDAVRPEMDGGPGVRKHGLNAIANTKFLWPNGQIPYVINAELPEESKQNIRAAANQLNALTLDPAAPSSLLMIERDREPDYVEFVQGTDKLACSSAVGRQGGRQVISFRAGGCRVSTILHETLHAAGVKHEQSRADRDEYVQILEDKIQSERLGNFEKLKPDAFHSIGPYGFTSIMHYGPFAFGIRCTPNPPPGQSSDPDCSCSTDEDGKTTCSARTIKPRQAGVAIVRDTTLAADIEAIRALYPGRVGPAQGLDWGDGQYATAAAMGDIDGDGRAEIIVGRHADGGGRLLVYDDAHASHALLVTAADWGSGTEVTDLDVGDVDGDGIMEIGVTRRAGSHNRFYVYRYRNGGLVQVFAGGNDWGSGTYATAIAFGDVDGDGRDEVAVGRHAGESGRYYLFDDAAAATPFRRLAIGGSNWGSGDYTTGLALGDVDGDGRDELGVTRRAGANQRYEIVRWVGGRLAQAHSGGQDWDATHHGSAIAFGNIDDDRAEEIIVGRKAASGSRFHVLDDSAADFRLIQTGGDLWGSGYYAVGVGMADVDGDGRDEVLVARNAGEHGRYYVFDFRDSGFLMLPVSGELAWSGVGATDIAAADTTGDGKADVVVTYDQKVSTRVRFEVIYMNPAGS